MINLDYQPTVQDRLEASQSHVFSVFPAKFLWLSVIYFLIASGGFLWLSLQNFWMVIYKPSQIPPGSSIPNTIYNGFVFLGISIWILHTYFPKYSPFKLWTLKRDRQRQAIAYKPRSFTIDETGVTFNIEGYQEFKQWGHYLKFQEAKEMFLLYYSENLYHILPKRVFTDSSEIDRIRCILEKI
jgi:YcxB-like protein